jgi:hypothetical protein
MTQAEAKYWDSEFSDAEIDAIADKGAMLIAEGQYNDIAIEDCYAFWTNEKAER